MSMIKFVIYGEAVPKARPKLVLNRYTNKPHLYTAEKTRNWEQCVLGQALKTKPDTLIDGPIGLMIAVYKKIPKSWSKKKAALAASNTIRPTGRPDLSNYIKSIEDALNGLYWADDGAVVEYLQGTGKYFSLDPHVDIEVHYDTEHTN